MGLLTALCMGTPSANAPVSFRAVGARTGSSWLFRVGVALSERGFEVGDLCDSDRACGQWYPGMDLEQAPLGVVQLLPDLADAAPRADLPAHVGLRFVVAADDDRHLT
jgi:hypothetical protein